MWTRETFQFTRSSSSFAEHIVSNWKLLLILSFYQIFADFHFINFHTRWRVHTSFASLGSKLIKHDENAARFSESAAGNRQLSIQSSSNAIRKPVRYVFFPIVLARWRDDSSRIHIFFFIPDKLKLIRFELRQSILSTREFSSQFRMQNREFSFFSFYQFLSSAAFHPTDLHR